jgi:cyclic-di-GMP-binding protein
MASLDIVSKVDAQVVENAILVAKKEILNRYDFHGSNTEVDFNKKELTMHLVTETDMRMEAILDIIIARGVKQGIDPRSYDTEKPHYSQGTMLKKDIKMRNGLDKEAMKKITKAIKDSGLKVQAAQMDQIIRVTAKKIDDLQAVMTDLRRQDFGFPLQFENMKS